MTRAHIALIAGLSVLGTVVGLGQGAGQLSSQSLEGLAFRSIGPTLSTGRVADITVDPNRPDVYFVATAVGGLWKSDNRGDSWKSVFDDGGSFNMCCVVVDPKNSNVVWLGTGENSNPRSSTYGDGIYKSTDGGDHFSRVGLESSEHIGAIKIDPRNSDVVWVAAQGPLWSSGGDRGVFKTTDGGKTWKASYTVSPNTGASDLVIDPNNPEVVYASLWQRQRGVGLMVGGGPEGGIVKTSDGGKTWQKLEKGLPSGDIGRIALGVDPKAKPTRVYALVNGLPGDSGFFRSDDAGASFHRMGAPYGKGGVPEAVADQTICDQPQGRRGGNAAAAPPAAPPAGSPPTPQGGRAAPPAGGAGAGARGAAAPRGGGRGCDPGAYCGGDPGYYQEIYVDPVRKDTVWSANTNLEWTQDGGRCWSPVPSLGGVHVDFHAVWFDTSDPNHIMVGNDGGAYESFDEGKTWRHFDNLPVTQFYRIAVDDALPFYNVCAGAQDNESQCGPSRTINRVGIRMSDWWMTGGCDGFQSRIEPGNPNIVYSACQSGSVSRMDLRTGESKPVRPQGANILPGPYDPPTSATEPANGAGRGGRGGGRGGERTNWDAPYIISPFSPTRLYYGTDVLYRSDDRGDHWVRISHDLTRNLDYNTIPIMGKLWTPDSAHTVAWNNATTPGSTIVSLDESPLAEGLIYVGTDDGLLQVTEDGGKTWRKTEHFPNVPDGVWLTDVRASPLDSNVVFVTLNNWQRGDYKPYIVRSDDRGKTFQNITGDFPNRMDVYSIDQDFEDANLVFAGAEFGLFVTVDGGQHWVEMKGGLPTAQVRDLTIQRRESDLVLATFGRSIYILDDISPLRAITAASLSHDAELYPLRHAYAYAELGYPQAAWGNTTTPNPPVGATFTYSVGSGFSGKLAVNVENEAGKTVCRMDVPETVGIDRATWNLRVELPPDPSGRRGGGGGRGEARNTTICSDPAAPPPPPPSAGGFGGGFGRGNTPPLVAAGYYTATLGRLDGDKFTPIGTAQRFEVVPLPAKNW